jgi:hypothetical protein
MPKKAIDLWRPAAYCALLRMSRNTNSVTGNRKYFFAITQAVDATAQARVQGMISGHQRISGRQNLAKIRQDQMMGWLLVVGC